MLVNGAKHALTIFAFHFNANGVTEFHKLGARLAIQNGLDGALLCNAAVAFGPLGLAIDVNAFVTDRAAANNGASAHVACFAHVRNQLAKVKRHFRSGFAHAHFAAIPC